MRDAGGRLEAIAAVSLASALALVAGCATPNAKTTPVVEPVDDPYAAFSREVILYHLEIHLPEPTEDRAEAERFGRRMLAELELAMAGLEAAKPTSSQLGHQSRHPAQKTVHVYLQVNDEEALWAFLKSYPFATTTLLVKQTTVTETQFVKRPER
jgi:hypothetical protein